MVYYLYTVFKFDLRFWSTNFGQMIAAAASSKLPRKERLGLGGVGWCRAKGTPVNGWGLGGEALLVGWQGKIRCEQKSEPGRRGTRDT